MPASQAKTIFLDRAAVAGGVGRCAGPGGAGTGQGTGDRGFLALHLLHLGGGGGDVAVVLLADLQEQGGEGEADRGRGQDRERDAQVGVTGGHAEDREDRAGRGGGLQASAEQGVHRDARHAAADRGEDEDRLHQHVGEVDLVDAAEELDDRGAGGRGACGAAAEDRVGEQDADAGAGVGLEQEQDGLAIDIGLRDAQRGEHAVVDGVVEEEDLRRLDEQRHQRQQPRIDQGGDAIGEQRHQAVHQRGEAEEPGRQGDEAEDAGREHVHQHLEAGGDVILPDPVEASSSPRPPAAP